MADKKIRYDSVCRYCGKVVGSDTTSPSLKPATMSGTCPNSPDKKHDPEWQPSKIQY